MIRSLAQQGLGIRAIARHLGIDRNTVRRALRREGVPKYTRRQPRAAKLDPLVMSYTSLHFKKDCVGRKSRSSTGRAPYPQSVL